MTLRVKPLLPPLPGLSPDVAHPSPCTLTAPLITSEQKLFFKKYLDICKVTSDHCYGHCQ